MRKVQPIAIRGARVHNLKGVDCDLPRNSLVVITGPSGSGKSSLAFDTLYAEGQRRYVESLSAYARQFLDQLEKPDVDSVSGLSPAIAIEQRTTSSHPRSTVGTVTEIYDHLRVLFAGVGRPHCPRCGEPVTARTAAEIADAILETAGEAPVSVLAPVARGRKGAFRKELDALRAAGYHRVRVDGGAFDLDEAVPLDPRRNHRIEVLVDRLAARPAARRRLVASLERALDLAKGVVLVTIAGEERLHSRTLACARCDVSVAELSPRAFSFNSAYGACPACQGLGWRWLVDAEKVIPDAQRPLGDGAIHPWQSHGSAAVREALEDVAARHGFSLDQPLAALPQAGSPRAAHRGQPVPGHPPPPDGPRGEDAGPGRRRRARPRSLREPAPVPERDRVRGLPRRAAPAGEPGRPPRRAVHRGLRPAHHRAKRRPRCARCRSPTGSGRWRTGSCPTSSSASGSWREWASGT